MAKLIECVPNYSEGRNKAVIEAIVDAIRSVEGVKVLDVDPGEATNRTVVTFVGAPEPVLEAAFRGAAKAQELIDMRTHHGAHPRSGATDVLPLIPVSDITLEECAALARQLAERLYNELGIPCYCYEAAAFKPERRNLAVCREGEYEALPEKMADPDRKPDFGGGIFTEKVARCGATNVGARGFLVAVNFNLNTTSTRRAMAVAFDVREKGRKAREGGSLTGKLLKDENGNQIWIPGTLKGCKAIGWDIDEYGMMADFADRHHPSELHSAISGRGAFRRFKDVVRRMGLEQEWYQFRDAEYKRVAQEWCEDCGIILSGTGEDRQ